eukprot:351417-Amphidinium_carterae.1
MTRCKVTTTFNEEIEGAPMKGIKGSSTKEVQSPHFPVLCVAFSLRATCTGAIARSKASSIDTYQHLAV